MLEESENKENDGDEQKHHDEEESESKDDDVDSENFGSEIDDKVVSDLEDARRDHPAPKCGTKKEKDNMDKVASKKRSPPQAEDDNDEEEEEEEEEDVPKKKSKKAAEVATTKKKTGPPKKPMSAYFLFQLAMRLKIMNENPDALFGDIARLVSSTFKALSVEERREWDEKASAYKLRYKDEMESYNGGEYPDVPKRAGSALSFYLAENQATIKEGNPDISCDDLAKLLGNKFKNLPAGEQKEYEKIAKADKERYMKEMAAYKQWEMSKKAAPESDSNDSDSDDVNEEDDDDDDDDSDECNQVIIVSSNVFNNPVLRRKCGRKIII